MQALPQVPANRIVRGSSAIDTDGRAWPVVLESPKSVWMISDDTHDAAVRTILRFAIRSHDRAAEDPHGVLGVDDVGVLCAALGLDLGACLRRAATLNMETEA